MTKEAVITLAAMVGISTTVGGVAVEVFGINLVLLLWTAVGSLVAVAVTQELTRVQALTQFSLGTAVGAVATPFALNVFEFANTAWAHRFVAATCGALALVLLQLAVRKAPTLFDTLMEWAKSWLPKKGG